MNSKNPILFLLEDCPATALLVERAVMNDMPNVRLLWARSLQEAEARAEGLPIDLFLVDIGLPDGNGLDFLWKMARQHPKARAIVMTASPLPEHEMHSAALGVLHFLEKPLKLRPLLNQLRSALDAAAASDDSAVFRATLENVTPADVLQLKCLTGSTTIVEFLSDGNVGRIRFEDGEIADASVGEKKGVEAVYEIIAWKHGRVSEQPAVGFFKRTINCPWHQLLMEAAQQADERQAVA